MSFENIEKPIRSKGENTWSWISRRDSYRINELEKQIAQVGQLSNRLKKLEGKKK